MNSTKPLDNDIELLETEYFPVSSQHKLSVEPPIQFNNTSEFMQWFELKVETHNIQPSPLKACNLTREEVLRITKDMYPSPEEEIKEEMVSFTRIKNIITKSRSVRKEDKNGVIHYSFSDIKKLINSVKI